MSSTCTILVTCSKWLSGLLDWWRFELEHSASKPYIQCFLENQVELVSGQPASLFSRSALRLSLT